MMRATRQRDALHTISGADVNASIQPDAKCPRFVDLPGPRIFRCINPPSKMLGDIAQYQERVMVGPVAQIVGTDLDINPALAVRPLDRLYLHWQPNSSHGRPENITVDMRRD